MPLFWPALIAAAVGLVKIFFEAAASAAGTAAIQLIVAHLGRERQQAIVAGSRPSAPRPAQITTSQELLALLKNNDAAFREARSILATAPKAVRVASQQVERQLEQAPELVQEVVSGRRCVTDLAFPLQLWNQMSEVPVSEAQARYLQSDVFRKICPVGGEDLGSSWDVVNYYWNTTLGTEEKVKLPTILLIGRPEHYVAVCSNGHRWPVFAR